MKRLVAAVLFFSLILAGHAQNQDRVDMQVLAKIRSEGMERSRVIETFNYLTTVIGRD